jgi:hypothetical protein
MSDHVLLLRSKNAAMREILRKFKEESQCTVTSANIVNAHGSATILNATSLMRLGALIVLKLFAGRK